MRNRGYTLGILRETAGWLLGRDIDACGIDRHNTVEAVARMAAVKIDLVLRRENRCAASMGDGEVEQIVKECGEAFFRGVEA